MSKQEQQDEGQRIGPRSLLHATPSYPPYPSNTTGRLNRPQERASFGDIYQPVLQRAEGPSSNSQQQVMSSTGQSSSGKVAIPALRSSKADIAKAGKKNRTSHACDTCRKAKAGCSGGQPCSRCRTIRSNCVYGDGKRDRDRKELSKLSRETQFLAHRNSEIRESLLRLRRASDLSIEDMKCAIDDILAKKQDSQSPNVDSASPRPQFSEQGQTDEVGDDEAGAEAGSIGSLDETAVDTDRPETVGIGHLGKASASEWQHRTEEIVTKEINERGQQQLPPPATVSTYHTEDADIDLPDMAQVNPYGLPSAQLSGDLVQTYFDHVHSIFPILDKADFLTKYHAFDRDATNMSSDGLAWLATLNCVLAISAYQGRLTNTRSLGESGDHLIYCARATILILQQDMRFQDATISIVSTLGLLGLYFLSTNRINKSWSLIGIALRHALTLGLHVRSVSKKLTDLERENRVRLFWSLYVLECSLNELCGRPPCIADRDIGTPLPLNIEECDLRIGAALYDAMEGVQSQNASNSSDSARGSRTSATFEMPSPQEIKLAKFSSVPLPLTSSTFFIYRIQLTILSHQTITQIYCAATTKEKWNVIEDVMGRIDASLTNWERHLPANFNVTITPGQPLNLKDQSTAHRVGLSLMYQASRMILFRPCVCPSKDHTGSQTKAARAYSDKAAEKCIGAARTIISTLDMLGNTSEQIFSIPPFWNTLHWLCEALAVLLLELALKCKHLRDGKLAMLADVKKGIKWLVGMSAVSISARKAWEIYDKLLHMVAHTSALPVHDMPTQAPVPPGYNFFRQHSISREVPNTATSTQQQVSQQCLPDISYYGANQPQNFAQHIVDQTDFQHFANPLDDAAAFERFSSIGGLYGQFDDPWQNYLMTPGMMGNVMPQGQGVIGMEINVPSTVPTVGSGAQMGMQEDVSSGARSAGMTYNNANAYQHNQQARYE